MKASELIADLAKLIAQFGDLPVLIDEEDLKEVYFVKRRYSIDVKTGIGQIHSSVHLSKLQP